MLIDNNFGFRSYAGQLSSSFPVDFLGNFVSLQIIILSLSFLHEQFQGKFDCFLFNGFPGN